MKTPQHTPGPWYPDDKDECLVRGKDGRRIAFFGTSPDSEYKGKYAKRRNGDVENALLCAAAPDMLAALEATLQDLRVRGELCSDGVLELNISNGILYQLECAIAKAKGKEKP